MALIHVITDAKTGEVTEREFTQDEVNEYNIQAAAAGKAAALAELAVIDAASVRAIREYIASKADAPQILKDKETAAVLSRAKLK